MTEQPLIQAQAAYKRIEESLRERIRKGHWTAGTMLPGRRDLAREYGVSVMTIERAVTRLVEDSLLRTDDRRGTFVTESTRESSLTHRASGNHDLVFRAGETPQAQLAPVRTDMESVSDGRRQGVSTVGIIASMYLYSHDHRELHNFWMRVMLGSIEHSLANQGSSSYFYNRVQGAGQPLVPLSEALSNVKSTGVDGIVVIGFGMEPQDVEMGLQDWVDADIPITCITQGKIRLPVPHVFNDQYSAGYQAAKHLLSHGHRDIVFFSPYSASWVKQRLDGVRAAVELAGLSYETVRVIPGRNHTWMQEEDPEVAGFDAAKAAFGEGMEISAVISANDGAAFGFVAAATEQGLAVGRDYAIIGFDDHPNARTLGLTTVRPPMEAMGEEAARLLLCALRGEQPSLQVRLRWHLVPRSSTRARSTYPTVPASIADTGAVRTDDVFVGTK